MNSRSFPWYDYGGQFSVLRAATLAALLVPGVCTTVWFELDQLGARPLTAAIHEFGDWTIRLIFISLVISPARIVLQWPRLLELRRLVGVAAFSYAAMHLTLYYVDEAYDLGIVATEIIRRIYLTIGFTTLTGLAVLAITSTDGWQRRLGARRWQSVHRFIYLIALLAVIHFCLQSKLDEWEPTVMAGIYLWLIGCRVITWRYGRGKLPLWTMISMSIAAAILTALGEAFYFWLALGAPMARVLAADLSLDTGVRPAWIVLASTIGVAVLAALRMLVKPPTKARLKAA